MVTKCHNPNFWIFFSFYFPNQISARHQRAFLLLHNCLLVITLITIHEESDASFEIHLGLLKTFPNEKWFSVILFHFLVSQKYFYRLSLALKEKGRNWRGKHLG